MRMLLAVAGGGSGFVRPTNESLTFPIRAAYYFPWWPEGWDDTGATPPSHYTPSLGQYDLADSDVLTQHMLWAKEAHIDALIATWQGRSDGQGIAATVFPGWPPSDLYLGMLLDAAATHGIKVCILYGADAADNAVIGRTITQAEITADLAWLATNRFNHRAYLHVDGRPVVFVYTEEDKSSTICAKWSGATSSFSTAYILMQTGSDPSAATPQPDAWYTFTTDRTSATTGSYTILPGFWRYSSGSPITSRNLGTWQSNVASMVASGADWQLIISFNEWYEGSMIEPADEYGTDYLDALADVP